MLGQDEYGYEPESMAWAYEDEMAMPEIEPAAWVKEWVAGYTPAEVASQGGGALDIVKSILGIVSPIAQSILKATGSTIKLPTTVSPTITAAKTTTPSTGVLASLTSSPLLLVGLAVGGFMLLRKKGKGKKRGRR